MAKKEILAKIKVTKSLKLNDFNTTANGLKYHLETIKLLLEMLYKSKS